ncbi:hypothetical protein [Dryocola clanedunensis]
MANSIWTNLEHLSVSLPSGDTHGKIYANGNMQVAVQVNVKAVDKHGLPVQLIEEDIDSIVLIDNNSGGRLMNGWGFSRSENSYLHTMPDQVAEKAPGEEVDPRVQIFTFWVSCHVVSIIAIGASIVAPDGTVYNTREAGSTFYSYIMLEGVNIPKYTLTDVDFTRFDTAKPVSSTGIIVDQDNYYLSLKNGLSIVAVDWMTNEIPLFAAINQSSSAQLYYAWPLAYASQYVINDSPVAGLGELEIIINDRAGQVCFSRIACGNVPLDAVIDTAATFTVFDQYGTAGHFSVTQNAKSFMMKIENYL